MMISEVIEELEKLRDEHGEIPVAVYDGSHAPELLPVAAFDVVEGDAVCFPLGVGGIEKAVRIC